MKPLILSALLISMLGSSGAFAMAAKHGGKVAQTSGHHFLELVVKDGSMDLHVLHEDGEAQNVDGAKGTAVILSGGQKEQISLTPSGSVLTGAGSFQDTPGTVVVVTLTMPKHKPEQARFVLD